MKHFLVALALCALPATAFAQNGSCRACDHVAPYFRGTGGFIGTVAEGVDEVTFVASCGSVATTGPAEIHGETASQLFTHGNGLACNLESGALEIAGLEDGGWYWINDVDNSAVGNLVPADILGNETTEITNAGDSVSMTAGRGAVFLRHPASGRVGILPNILPEPATPAPRRCGYDDRGTRGTVATAAANAADAQFVRRITECALGDGGTITLATATDPVTGATTQVPDKASLVRPSGTGEVVVIVDLWGNHSGFFTTAADGHALLGQPSVSMGPLRENARLTGVTYTATLRSGPGGETFTAGTELAGITMDATATVNAVTFTIAADDTYCNASPPRNHSATVSVTATMTDAASAAQVTPPRTRNSRSGAVGSTSFTVVCS